MGSEIARATIQIGEKKITIEGPPDFVSAQLEKFAATEDVSPQQVKGTDDQSQPLLLNSESQMIRQKQPRSHPETVAVLAFTLAESGTAEFTEEDIRRAYIRAGVRPPKVVAQAIRDAKNNFDYVENGSVRGTYRLSHHGERTVRFDLPGKSSD
jgi:hypothetical protein